MEYVLYRRHRSDHTYMEIVLKFKTARVRVHLNFLDWLICLPITYLTCIKSCKRATDYLMVFFSAKIAVIGGVKNRVAPSLHSQPAAFGSLLQLHKMAQTASLPTFYPYP